VAPREKPTHAASRRRHAYRLNRKRGDGVLGSRKTHYSITPVLHRPDYSSSLRRHVTHHLSSLEGARDQLILVGEINNLSISATRLHEGTAQLWLAGLLRHLPLQSVL
jgi:hypothetical protein